jgi:hypothetical protein
MPERLTGVASEQMVVRGDLNMLVGLGGRERTHAELAGLLDRAGFSPGRCVEVRLGYSVMEGRR